MPAGHRVHLGITDAQMPAMRRLWDEGLCDLEWTRKDLVHKIATCHQCPVRELCGQTGRDEDGETWGWRHVDPDILKAARKRLAPASPETRERAASRRRAKAHTEYDAAHCPAGHPRTRPGKCPQCAKANQRAWYLRLKARAVARGVSTEQQRRDEKAARLAAEEAA
jgi:hypothetical protein